MEKLRLSTDDLEEKASMEMSFSSLHASPQKEENKTHKIFNQSNLKLDHVEFTKLTF